ncbi:NAD(P)H-hydrate dehydratase [Cellulomonas timonensis]|uniref:NAD(P)H-hydrate dehydratase n=1 Tax=Cellulomonas timonensis TaxID=1689271 RepID=UPI00082D81C2|nr:NAD(P)H-hydrate dehydratase [Cellulomonas timonensis]
MTPALLRSWPLDGASGSKDARGAVLVVGGARSTPGAAMLAGLAALRVGAGRLTLAVGGSVATAVGVAVPECAALALPETDAGLLTDNGVATLGPELERASTVLVGPGLDGADETRALLTALLPRIGDDTSVVLDAFALGVLAELPEAVREPLRGRLVLTPNSGEAARLLPLDPASADVGDLGLAAARIADRHGAVVTLRGEIATPDGAAWQSSTGSDGLATSGSGDVLAGAVAGVLAGGGDLAQAACWGTHLHGAAGDRLAAHVGHRGYLARELLDELPLVLTELLA